MNSNLRFTAWLILIVWLALMTVYGHSAGASFLAPNTKDPAFYGERGGPLRFTVDEEMEEVVLEFPTGALGDLGWPPPVAVSFYSAAAVFGDCGHWSLGTYQDDEDGSQWWGSELLGYCIGKLTVEIGEKGRSSVRVPLQWFRDAMGPVHDIHRRHQTCLETGGAVDVLYPGQRCPGVGDGRGTRNYVARPWSRLRIQFQWNSGGNPGAEFFFVGEAYAPSPYNRNWSPAVFHYGDLERVYSWLEEGWEESPGGEEACSCEETE